MSEIKVNKISPRLGTDVTLGDSGDTLTIPSGATIANSGTATGFGDNLEWQSVETGATFTAVAGKGYPVNTTAQACTVTLPASASVGDQIIFTDYARNWDTYALTINPNSLNYQGNSSPNPVYDTAGESLHIVYMDATKGWVPLYDGAVALETPQTYNIEHLVVAGGGGGGRYTNGGGGGGYLTNTVSYTKGVSSVLTVVVGAGGAGGSAAPAAPNGANSSITSSGSEATVTSDGGGGGGSGGSSGAASSGADGGSGGGASQDGGSGGSATAGQGYDGGDCPAGGYGAAGGGAGAVGGVGVTSPYGADGGDGLQNDIVEEGVDVYYAGGGAGSGNSGTKSGGQGGGGGTGASNAGTPGTDELGGGGGGGGGSGNGGDGGDGIVILRILTADYSGTSSGSPTISTDGSYTVLKFTVDGTYTID